MERGQSLPRAWLITDERIGAGLAELMRRLPRGTGVILRSHGAERRRLMRIARSRALLVVEERRRSAARVHDAAEVRQARLAGAGVLLLSPIHPTRSHPERRPLPRMRAAALARLAGQPVIALGGMNARRFDRVRALGFSGWAGIDAWRAVGRGPSRE